MREAHARKYLTRQILDSYDRGGYTCLACKWSSSRAKGSGMHTRCPSCEHAIEVLAESSLSDVACPVCGSSFSLLPQETVTYEAVASDTIGHFELLEKVGTGAFGTVWRARDTQLDRTVAIKIPRQDQLDSVETEKFLREARAAAQVQHPNIVNVHEVGREGETVYIVSDFIKGLTLGDWLTGKRPSHREAAEMVGKVASALHHAHEAGVIHRDVKPSNIMLDADGEPHLMDFGLAKREAGEVTITVDGKVLGTPAYMSPEQARGEGHQVTRRSDVYSVGVVLFELITGERPFRGNMRMLLHQVLNEEAPSPRKVDPKVPKDLETICLKCLEKEPAKRYASAGEVAGELERFVRGEPVQARRVSKIERAWRWSKRNPVVAGLLGVAGVSLLISAVLAIGYLNALRPLPEPEPRLRRIFANVGGGKWDYDIRDRDTTWRLQDFRNVPPKEEMMIAWVEGKDVRDLNLESANIDDLGILSPLGRQLHRLNVDTSKPEARGRPLRVKGCGLSGLVSFEADYRELDLAHVADEFRGLTRLSIREFGGTDLTPLAPLKLAFLDFSYTEVEDASALAKMTSLREVIFRNTKVKSLDWAKGLTGLQRMEFVNSPIPEEAVEALSGCQNLTFVCAEGILYEPLAKILPNAKIVSAGGGP